MTNFGLRATFSGQTLKIWQRNGTSIDRRIDVQNDEIRARVNTKIRITRHADRNKILLIRKVTDNRYLVVYSGENNIWYYLYPIGSDASPLAPLLNVRIKVLSIKLSQRGLRIFYRCVIENKYGLRVSHQALTVDDKVVQKVIHPIYEITPSRLEVWMHGTFSRLFPMKDLLSGEPPINTTLGIQLRINDKPAFYPLRKKENFVHTKWYYATVTATKYKETALGVRRNPSGAYVLVRRPVEPIERVVRVRILNFLPVTFLLYHLAHIVRALSNRKVNIYFEKNAEKAEEGTFEVFQEARKIGKSTSRNYYLLNGDSPDYRRLRKQRGVVKNYTLRSYWLSFRANAVISTEAPQHSNVLRTTNKYVRQAPYTQQFVFLQHGVTYMKNQGHTSAFIAGRDAEPDYMVVGSKKEKDAVIRMLRLKEEQILITGLPIFDNIRWEHITQDSPDIITIMLTWKPYEEHLVDFSKSTYYKYTLELYKLLSPLVGSENIRIVAHPKFKKFIETTDMGKTIWDGTVAEVLAETKLLITDYSSVAYNTFYQGGGVVFYQPDLKVYESYVGELIPKDDEYIGRRVFTLDALRKVIKAGIKNGRGINLSSFRNNQDIENYLTINQYHDGKNVVRICRRLSKLDII